MVVFSDCGSSYFHVSTPIIILFFVEITLTYRNCPLQINLHSIHNDCVIIFLFQGSIPGWYFVRQIKLSFLNRRVHMKMLCSNFFLWIISSDIFRDKYSEIRFFIEDFLAVSLCTRDVSGPSKLGSGRKDWGRARP